MVHRLVVVLNLAGVLLLVLPGAARGEPIAIDDDRVYRVGVFLVVEARVVNRAAQRVEGVEATVEFLDFFGELVRIEHTVVSPVTLGPGHVGALRVVTPHSDAVRSLQYRFTWRERGEQFQAVVRRDIWRMGAATRNPNRWR